MFKGKFALPASVGVGVGKTGGEGTGKNPVLSNYCPPCKTSIEDVVYTLSAVAFAGLNGWGRDDISFTASQQIR